jgi:hypothetical protein
MVMPGRVRLIRPVAIAAGRRVEEQWASMIGTEDLEALRGLLQRLLLALREEDPA